MTTPTPILAPKHVIANAVRCVACALILLATPMTARGTELGRVDVDWETMPTAELKKAIESSLNRTRERTVTEARLSSFIESTLAILADHGHYRATVKPENFRLTDDSLTFSLSITSGPTVVVTQWDFTGLMRTDSLWLSQAVDLPIDVPITRALLERAQSTLSQFGNISLAGPPEVVVASYDSSATIRLKLREQLPARIEGAFAAGPGEGAHTALLGRFSLGIDGLFRRDRSLRLRYEHPQASERLLRLEHSDRMALSRRLSTKLSFEDWRRSDHRQEITADATINLSTRQKIGLTAGLDWRKVSPLASIVNPSRTIETSLGLTWGHERQTHISLNGVSSQHRQWQRATLNEDASWRLRWETEAVWIASLTTRTRLHVSAGGRWWESGRAPRSGDEWFLGGEVLSGYPARSLSAYEGLWSKVALSRVSTAGLGAALFFETARLAMFDGARQNPSSLGLAIILQAPGRSGRLELAWKDRATFEDGILRLSVMQGW